MKTENLKERVKKQTKENLQRYNKSYKEIINCILSQQEIVNPESLAKFYDYEADKLLEISTQKQDFCKRLIKEINKAFSAGVTAAQKQTLITLKENILGKLFYLALQDNKYLIIDNLTDRQKKNEVLAELAIIKSSAEKAVLYLDMLENGAHRNFINGIISYIY